MLTEQFVNLCCVVLTDDNPKISPDIINNIGTILNFYKDDDIALNFKNKFNLCKIILKLRLKKLSIDQIIDNIIVSGKFKEIEEFLLSLSERKIEDDKIDIIIKQIHDRKKYVSILRDLPLVEGYVKQFNNNSYSDLDEILTNWDILINQSYSRIIDDKKLNNPSKINNLDLYNDNFKNVLDQIEVSYSGKNSISTGYKELDDYMNGGFEPGRLYVFAGASGDGKSTFLLNFLKNGAERKKDPDSKKEIFIYFTLENLVDESLVRLYCSLSQQTIKDVMKNFQENRSEIENYIKAWQEKNNSVIIMAYFPPTLTSMSDLMGYTEQVELKYTNIGDVKGIYIDYLDLLKSGQSFDMYRLEMGQITIDLKVFSVLKRVPVVSLTQLNRSGYDKDQPSSLAQVGEAIKKVENSDFVGLLKSIYDEKELNDSTAFDNDYIKSVVSIKKNRSGPKEKTVNFLVKFDQFRVVDNSRDVSVPFENNTFPDDGFV